MVTTKIFINGKDQAVRLPKDCQFKEGEVLIKKIGDIVVLFPIAKALELFKNSFEKFPSGFKINREIDYPLDG